MADPDWTDPCAVLNWVRPQYYKVASGQQVIMVRDGESQAQFSIASIDKLDALMRRLESECAAAQGKRRRRAFTAG